MAKTITQLPDASVVNDQDDLIIQQSGITKKATKLEVIAGIKNASIANDAAIAASKLAGTLDLSTKTLTLPATCVATSNITDGNVTASKLSGAQSGSAPIYGCRAWVNFSGSFTAVTTNSYTRTGTTVVVTRTAHGLDTGFKLAISAATDSGLNTATAATASTEITRIDANSFSFQTASTGTASGTLTYFLGIRASGNVASVVRNDTGDFTINFTTAMPDANYCVTALVDQLDSSAGPVIVKKSATAYSTTSLTVICRAANGVANPVTASLAVFR